MVELLGHIVDLLERRIFKGRLKVENGRIVERTECVRVPSCFILPGFIDSHVHIESSLLPPSEFARLCSIHGTIGALCDPHEIANVLGVQGIEFMLENARKVRFRFFFGAPPCVPATTFETSGAKIGSFEIEALLQREEICFLSEVMDVQGVLEGRRELMEKIEAARRMKKPIDGHAPGLRGEALRRYVECGIKTDHETEHLEEAQEKVENSMRLVLRYGSISKAFERLIPMLKSHPENCMFGSDDKAPNELVRGHLDEMVRKAVSSGCDLFDALSCACMRPRFHYGLSTGLLRIGDPADFIIVDNLKEFRVLHTFVEGECIASGGKSLIPRVPTDRPNKFETRKVEKEDFSVPMGNGLIRVIALDKHTLLTRMVFCEPKVERGMVVADVGRDILKVAVVNRYMVERPSIGFVKGFGLREGAIASSVLHDSHHFVVLGTRDDLMAEALQLVMEVGGGLSFVSDSHSMSLPLPIAGLMSDEDGFLVASLYERINDLTRSNGCSLALPFMALSFIGLPVIPEIRLTTKGLFHVGVQRFVPLFMDDKPEA